MPWDQLVRLVQELLLAGLAELVAFAIGKLLIHLCILNRVYRYDLMQQTYSLHFQGSSDLVHLHTVRTVPRTAQTMRQVSTVIVFNGRLMVSEPRCITQTLCVATSNFIT